MNDETGNGPALGAGRGNKTALILDSLESMGRSWWTLVAALVLCVATFVIVMLARPPEFVAVAGIGLEPVEQPRADSRREQLSEQLRAASLIRAATERYREMPSVDEVRQRLEVVATANPLLVELRVSDNDAEHAAGIVNAIAETYVEKLQNLATAREATTHGRLSQAVLAVSRALDVKYEELDAERALDASAFARGDLELLQNELDRNREQVLGQRNEIDELRSRGRLGDDAFVNECSRAAAGEGRVRELTSTLNGSSASGSPNAVEARRLRKELEQLVLDYTPSRKGISSRRECRSSLEAMREQGAERDKRIVDAQQILAQLEQEQQRLAARLQEVRQSLAADARRQERLGRLVREQQGLEQELERRRRSVAEARTENSRYPGANLLAPATVPQLATFGEPVRLSLAALLVGLLVFVGPVAFRGVFFAVVSSEAGLRAVSPVPLLISVPALAVDEVRDAKRHRLRKNVSLAVLTTLVAGLSIIAAYWIGGAV